MLIFIYFFLNETITSTFDGLFGAVMKLCFSLSACETQMISLKAVVKMPIHTVSVPRVHQPWMSCLLFLAPIQKVLMPRKQWDAAELLQACYPGNSCCAAAVC